MNILYYTKEIEEEASMRALLPEAEFEFRESVLADDAAGSDAEVLSIFTTSRVDVAVLAKFPNLKLIATRSTGFDHVDLAAAAARGIMVVNVPSYGMQTVAEYAFALMLELSRRVGAAQRRVQIEHSFEQKGLTGFDLEGKTLGIVGTGKIGAHAAKIAAGFGMRIVAYDVAENDAVKALGGAYMPLETLLAESDIVTLHVPNLPQTHHLINAENISKMKRGAYLINTARGAVVDTGALVAALDAGTLAGAALDVLEDESASAATLALANRPNVIVTPHIAFDTVEAKQRILEVTAENIKSFFAGAPKNIVQQH